MEEIISIIADRSVYRTQEVEKAEKIRVDIASVSVLQTTHRKHDDASY